MIADLIDEQRVADLVNRAPVILAAAHGDPIAECHITAQQMAHDLQDYLDVIVGNLQSHGSAQGHVNTVIRYRDHAQQLRAHHLDLLDRLTEA